MFRNATIFRFPPSLDLRGLDDGTRECALKPVGPLEMSSRGFVLMDGTTLDKDDYDQGYPYGLHPHTFLTVGVETKIMPGPVLAAVVAKRIAAVENSEGRKLGGRQRNAIREQAVADLLPTAMVKPSRVLAALTADLLVVDTSSRSVAESVVSDVRHALGSFPALPLNAEVSVAAIMTGWVAGDELPEGFTLGDRAWFEGVDRSTVKVAGIDLRSDEVAKHVEAGMKVVRLELAYLDRLQFVLDDGLVLRSIKFLDGALDDLSTETEQPDAPNLEMDARLLLAINELLVVFAALETAMKISKVE